MSEILGKQFIMDTAFHIIRSEMDYEYYEQEMRFKSRDKTRYAVMTGGRSEEVLECKWCEKVCFFIFFNCSNLEIKFWFTGYNHLHRD